MRVPQRVKQVGLLAPVSVNNNAIQTAFVSLSKYDHASFCIYAGAAAASIPVTISQSKNVTGSGVKSLSFTKCWELRTAASPDDEADEWIEVDVTSDTFIIRANMMYRVEIHAAMLDVDNGFDCARLNFAATSGATVFGAWVELFRGRYTGNNRQVMPSALVN